MKKKTELKKMRDAVLDLFADTDTITTEQWCKTRAAARALNWAMGDTEDEDFLENMKRK